MCRLNALVAVKRAGSGHLGSSFSALDLVAHLLFEELNVAERGFDDPERDVFFSSKGHDVPGLYAALFALGVVPRERLLRLRRLGGLDGHPDVGVPGIEASSGSLGMGISKGRGIALAKRQLGRGGRVVVMTGDGELQEGQNWEALQSAAHERSGRLWVVVDRNEVQSDKPTEEIVALGDLEAKLRAFGWHVETVDGHDHAALRAAFARFRDGGDAPKALVARTVKGKGVSFMEHPAALAEGGGTYRWHAGAPDDESFARARRRARGAHRRAVRRARPRPPALEPRRARRAAARLEGEPESGAGTRAAGDAVDATSTSSTRTARRSSSLPRSATTSSSSTPTSPRTAASARSSSPTRIASSSAGSPSRTWSRPPPGMARHGLLPVVNSFASFLASRANEQIYNQASEGSKVVYALHYAGLIPAGPGKSHQSIRDISLLGALPDSTIVQPGTRRRRGALRWAVEEADENVAMRLAIGPSPRRIELPARATGVGRGSVLREGDDAVLLSYGPVMLHEALLAAERLAESGEPSVAVVAMPWLNRFDEDWLERGRRLRARLRARGPRARRRARRRAAARAPGPRVTVFGVEGWPACGTPDEALRFHGLDGASLAERIAARSRAPPSAAR